MPGRTKICAVVFACVVHPLMGATQDLPARHSFRRVQVNDLKLRELVGCGYDGSPTFRRLIDRLESSLWFVFVQQGLCPDKAAVGCLLQRVGTFEGDRYVRVLVDPRGLHPHNAIATLGHELQHAVEVATASDPEVVETSDMLALFRRIGYVTVRTAKATIYETDAARQRGQDVLRELRGQNRGSPPPC